MAISGKEKLFNDLILQWNKKINLVSRRKSDIFDLISESKLFFDFIDFTKNPKIIDLGTGGGFPGIVLSIHYPHLEITLVDSIRKKISAVSDIVNKLGLDNIRTVCDRAEHLSASTNYKNSFDYVVARSVASLFDLTKWSKDLLKAGGKLVTLKGGELDDEIIRTNKQKFVKKVSILDKNRKKAIVVEFR